MTYQMTALNDSKSMSELKNRLTALTQNYSSQDDADVRYITRDKNGCYTIGIDRLPIADDQPWALDILNSEQGLQAWGDGGAPLGEIFRPVSEPLVQTSETCDIHYTHPQHGKILASWKPAYKLKLVGISDTYMSVRAEYSISSLSGTREACAILAAAAVRLSDSSGAFIPAILLKSETYMHKKYGQCSSVKLPIFQWLTINGLNELLSSSDTPDESSPTAAAAAAAAGDIVHKRTR